ncbi:CGNR zinc finger domain-containing protein [Streptomyces sp. NBC_01433]|uniref:CGNR zinc finger domain-containing protein n=1 Tax=Streptomyces sp. NBC_01433 TaxID=2903864 RepID=UPI00224E31B1|nr:CGNR zinc finger domain-containing protein [Streptomyces sp. NBC_01433]MCX4680927.1 CGNR zinc finger domain-containing protein [Streptomyces sp. NBC_01433]
MSDARLVLDLALTVRHEGRGGVADDLRTAADLTRWVHRHPGLLDAAWEADDRALAAVRSLRAAVRALFAHAVRPGAPGPADAGRLLPVAGALARLNAAAAAVPTVPVLEWPDAGEPVADDRPATGGGAGADLPAAALARAAIRFLAGPGRAALRACHAPRCARYFVKEHPRQEWCGPSCGNRARVARHHERHRTPPS